MSKPITYESKDHLAHITLRRPERRNALNAEMTALLNESFRRFAASDDELGQTPSHFNYWTDLFANSN